MRTIVDLSASQLASLDRISRTRKLSRAELIRRAVDRFLSENTPEANAAFGLWKRSGSRVDGLAHQRRLRRGWGG